jgi:DNA-binding PadR family transcriptional regulator
MPFRPAGASLPLTTLAFEILLALSEDDLHGYAILQAVEARVPSVLPLRSGTLYRALVRLEDDGLIAAIEPNAPDTPDERRRVYHLTARGRDVASLEAERLAGQVAAARARRLLPGSRRTR